MPLFERDPSNHMNPPDNSQRDASTASGSNSDAEASVAHIAELVRRANARQAEAGPSSTASTDATIVQPQIDVPPVALSAAPPTAIPVRPTMHRPSLRLMVAMGAVVGLLIVGVFAFVRPGSSAVTPPSVASAIAAPAGYAVKVTDVITDCASHSHGQTENSFESQNCVKATRFLATGRVSGRPVLFVMSRIRMASSEAAASIKLVLDANGTGNLNNLLSEGRTFPGAPTAMPSSGYASVRTGTVISVAEAGFIDEGSSSNTNPALQAAAAEVAALISAQG